MASSLRRSQIQKQVLSLYKECLRAAEVKSPSFKSVVRNEFKRNGAAIQRTDTMRVYILNVHDGKSFWSDYSFHVVSNLLPISMEPLIVIRSTYYAKTLDANTFQDILFLGYIYI